MKNTERRDAYIVEDENKTTIYIGNLQITLDQKGEQHGPLRGTPGATFWRAPMMQIKDGFLDIGTTEHMETSELDKTAVEEMRDLIK